MEIKKKMNETKYNNDILSLAKKKWALDGVQLKEFKKIKESRNKDKIIKIHNQQPLVKCLNEFNRLIKHTNKLFVYKYRIAPKDQKNNNMPNMTNKYLEEKRIKKNKSMEEIKNENKTEIIISKNKNDELSMNIEHKIDELIKRLRNQKLNFENNNQAQDS